MRTRGGQIAGFGAAVLALIVGSMFGLLGELGEGIRVIVGVELGMGGLLLAVAVATAIWGTLRPRGFAEISAEEIFRFTAQSFLFEPDLWRVHVRHLRSLGLMALGVQDAAETAANAIARALLAFLGGLGFSFLAIATLLVELV